MYTKSKVVEVNLDITVNRDSCEPRLLIGEGRERKVKKGYRNKGKGVVTLPLTCKKKKKKRQQLYF